MAKSSIVLTLSSTVQTHGWAFAQQALKPLYDGDPRLRPERVGLDDTDLRKKLPCARIEDVKPFWAPEAEEGDRHPERPVSDFYWKRMKAPRVEGMLGQSWRNSKGSLLPASVDLRATYAKDLDYMRLFEIWCKLYKPSQGYLHYFGKEELPQGRFITGETEAERVQEHALSSFALGSFRANYDQKTFNLGFASYFPESLMTPAVCADLAEQGFDVTSLGEVLCSN